MCRWRVSVTSTIAHQRLYGSVQIEMLDLGAYLSDICRRPPRSRTRLSSFVSAAEGVQIATDTAIPIARIVNELILNSAKYAYPGRSCQAWLTLTPRKRTQSSFQSAMKELGFLRISI